MNAFKHAWYGTPAPEAKAEGSKQLEKKAKLDAANAKTIDLPKPRQDGPPVSPSKQPGGILMTPGTANKGRKTVSFGSQVFDNEGKKGNVGKSGIPDGCPGKFPSPWTPGTHLTLDPASDKKPRTKLTEALLDARTTTQPKSGQKPKARDDNDITMDLGAPRSESGKYWKEQYESYAARSEKEMKKVIAKQQLAKKFAMKKDGEVIELATKLEQERKQFKQREKELEKQNKEYEERLRRALADNTSANIEVAALKARIANLEKSIAISSSDGQQSKASFQIYEDSSREPLQNQLETFAPSISMASSGKENSTPIPQHKHRETLLETARKINTLPELSALEGGTSIVLGKSPRVPKQNSRTTSRLISEPVSTALSSGKSPHPPLSIRKPDPFNGNSEPKSPNNDVAPSSPLPMPSPDPWLDMHESSVSQMDKMAMPGYSGQPYSRPEWNPPPRQNRTATSASVSRSRKLSDVERPKSEKAPLAARKAESRRDRSIINDSQIRNAGSQPHPTIDNKSNAQTARAEVFKKPETAAHPAPVDQKFDVSKITTHHAEGSTQVKQDRVELPIVDRKEQARRRLEERKKLRKAGP